MSKHHQFGNRHLVHSGVKLLLGSLLFDIGLKLRKESGKWISDEGKVGVALNLSEFLLSDDDHNLSLKVLNENILGGTMSNVGIDVSDEHEVLTLVTFFFLNHGI